MCDSITTHHNDSRQAFPTMAPLGVTFTRIPWLILPCGRRQHDGRCPCGSGFGSKPRAQLFGENLGEAALHPHSPRPAVSATGNGGCCGLAPQARPQQGRARLTEPAGTWGRRYPTQDIQNAALHVTAERWDHYLQAALLLFWRNAWGYSTCSIIFHDISGELFHLFY